MYINNNGQIQPKFASAAAGLSSLGLLCSAAVEAIPCSARKNLPSPVAANAEWDIL